MVMVVTAIMSCDIDGNCDNDDRNRGVGCGDSFGGNNIVRGNGDDSGDGDYGNDEILM